MAASEEWNEISVDVGWGFLRGKKTITGSSNIYPRLHLLGIHGWLDNANSFDRLIPLLPSGIEVIVIDLPGHGRSDHLPYGAHYNPMTYVINIRAAILKLGLTNFAVMAHSMGCMVAGYYIALFPKDVNGFILFDYMTPYHAQERIPVWRWEINRSLKTDKNTFSGAYSQGDAVKRLINSRRMPPNREENVDEESAKVLLERSAKQEDGKFSWCHDDKARVRFTMLYGLDNWLHIISSIKCPVLLLRATRGICILSDSIYGKVLDMYRQNAEVFKYHIIDSSHHMHLTEPYKLAPFVNELISELMIKQETFSSKL